MQNTFSLVQSLGAYLLGFTTHLQWSILPMHKKLLRDLMCKTLARCCLSAERWAEDAINDLWQEWKDVSNIVDELSFP